MCADKAVDLAAADVLSLGGNFIAQSSSIATENSYATMLAANGDIEKYSSTFNALTTVTIPYRFNADTGLGAALPAGGKVSNSYCITEIGIETTYNDYPTINFTAHNHGSNAHADDRNTYAVSIPASFTGAIGAYDLAGLAADEVCATSSSYTLSMNHVDAECSTGEHWTGQNIQGMESCTVEYIGQIATFTIADWTVTGYSINDSNEAQDTSSITFIKLLSRVV